MVSVCALKNVRLTTTRARRISISLIVMSEELFSAFGRINGRLFAVNYIPGTQNPPNGEDCVKTHSQCHAVIDLDLCERVERFRIER